MYGFEMSKKSDFVQLELTKTAARMLIFQMADKVVRRLQSLTTLTVVNAVALQMIHQGGACKNIFANLAEVIMFLLQMIIQELFRDNSPASIANDELTFAVAWLGMFCGTEIEWSVAQLIQIGPPLFACNRVCNQGIVAIVVNVSQLVEEDVPSVLSVYKVCF